MQHTRPAGSEAPAPRPLLVFLPFLLVSLVYLVAQFAGFEAIPLYTKPWLMVALLIGFLFALPTLRSGIARWGMLGIVFSWLGDTSLMYSGDLGFLAGLGFFLLAHLAYLVLFLRHIAPREGSRSRRRWALVYLAAWGVLIYLLAPHTGALFVPVAIYGAVLAGMAAVALSRNLWIAIGGACFLLSDAVLGLNRFHPEFSLWQAHVVIMFSYLAAQGLIAWGAVREARRRSAEEPGLAHPDAPSRSEGASSAFPS